MKIAREILERNAFQEIMPNFIEDSQVFLKTLGEDSDIISKEMYLVSTTSGDKKYILRPELTASVGRIALEHHWSQTLPKKVWYHGAMFRHERPQKGRMRQFYQLGVEYIGAPEVEADLGVLFSGVQILRKILGTSTGLEVEVNTIGDISARATYSMELTEWFNKPKIFSLLSEEDKKRSTTNPLRILDSKHFQSLEVASEVPSILAHLSQTSIQTYDKIISGLETLDIPYRHNPALVRGLDYYNDLCFEIKPKQPSTSGNKQNTLLAGGRYDQLLGSLSRDPKRNIKSVG